MAEKPPQRCTDGVVTETAYAKLNLTLEVLRERGDGYHEIASLMQTIDICDRLKISESDRLEVTCSDDSLSGSVNLAHAAALRLSESVGVNLGARIEITKRIPIAAGLGGGSSDAAAALRGLNRLWELGMTPQELMEVGSQVGSDVPFLVRGGTALVTGRGDEVTESPDANLARLVVAVPSREFPDSQERRVSKTAEVYQALSPNLFTNGSLSRRLAARVRTGGDCHPGFMFNVFQRLAPHIFPNWAAVYDGLAGLGARDIFLTGTGPAMFTLAPNRETGTLWASVIRHRLQCEAFATTTVGQVGPE